MSCRGGKCAIIPMVYSIFGRDDSVKIVKRKTAESFMKVMTALSVISGANGLSAIAVPQNPQVDIDAAVDGYALFVTSVAHAGICDPVSEMPISEMPVSEMPVSEPPLRRPLLRRPLLRRLLLRRPLLQKPPLRKLLQLPTQRSLQSSRRPK